MDPLTCLHCKNNSIASMNLTISGDVSVERSITLCTPVTRKQNESLYDEIFHYERSSKFLRKIQEVKTMRPGAHHVAINKYLTEKVLESGWSILELGCAAGMMLAMVEDAYTNGIGEHGKMVGIELVPGWVRFAQEHFKSRNIEIFEGDVTDFTLPIGEVFDFIMVNDVAEHIQKDRYGCFFEKIKNVSKPGTIVYFHTPTPEAQIVDQDQYLENTLPHHYLIMGMSNSGFELVAFEHDMDTQCGSRNLDTSIPRQIRNAKCSMNHYPKYYHAVFRRIKDPRVFELA